LIEEIGAQRLILALTRRVRLAKEAVTVNEVIWCFFNRESTMTNSDSRVKVRQSKAV
jgi:hypothetical protein